jgi:hypothetical protein
MADIIVPQSPEWWLARLYAQLIARNERIELFTNYYEGDHPLPWLAPQARDEFRRILRMTRSNYMGLVVDAMVERARVEGFRLSGQDSAGDPDDLDVAAMDADTWAIWQANDMDAGSTSVILESAICGTAYVQLEPNPNEPTLPFMWPEHPSQAIVDYLPGTGRRDRVAGLKVWIDDWTGQMCATVQLPSNIYKYGAKINAGGAPQWSRREVAGETWGGVNLAGEVALVEVPNNPRMLTGGVSEISDVIDTQDRINKTIADRLITQDFGAFPQKWMSGWPLVDEQGNVTPPIDIGRNRAVTTDVENAHFGQWDAAPLDPYSAAKREDVKDIASRTRTPAQYLLGEMNNVSGDTLQASQAGLIAKVVSRCVSWGEGFESGARVARRLAGLPDVGAKGMEAIWHNPEFRTLGELTDAVVKKLQVGIIDLRQAREDAGYTATQITRMENRQSEMARATIALRQTTMLQALADYNSPQEQMMTYGEKPVGGAPNNALVSPTNKPQPPTNKP